MRVALLAGGLGTRLSEETELRPKPMVEIGGRPILWHIMMHFYAYGHSDFAIALGYKAEVIKKWMVDLAQYEGDLKVSTVHGDVERLSGERPGWNVDLVETGLYTNTGGRVKRLSHTVENQTFFLAWGDGVHNVDLNKLLAFHKSHGKLATVTIVHPPARFGHVALSGDNVVAFEEKPQAAEGWINGGLFVLEPQVFDYIEGAETAFERAPMENLAGDGQLMAYRHEGYWQCMDTLRDKRLLEETWHKGDAPWATWEKEPLKCVS